MGSSHIDVYKVTMLYSAEKFSSLYITYLLNADKPAGMIFDTRKWCTAVYPANYIGNAD